MRWSLGLGLVAVAVVAIGKRLTVAKEGPVGPAQTRVFKVPGGESSLASAITVEVKADGAVATGYNTAALDGISFRTP